MTTSREVLEFWFGGVDSDATELGDAFERWFRGGEAVDGEIRERFGAAVDAALDGGLRDWEADIRERLALVILIDQFPRNIYRGTAHAYAGDARALRLAQDAVVSGTIETLSPVERVFLLMPYQHAEDQDVQQESVRLFADLAEHAPPVLQTLMRESLEYARVHRDIVARFGRFPHRNAALGRESTAEEVQWLEESGLRFGQ